MILFYFPNFSMFLSEVVGEENDPQSRDIDFESPQARHGSFAQYSVGSHRFSTFPTVLPCPKEAFLPHRAALEGDTSSWEENCPE
jgi:hypothetical protein